jgi:hypothetical protein
VIITTCERADIFGPPLLNERDVRSDELKAVAIFAVVAIHADIPGADILRFCVPLFIAIWAFHFEQALSQRGNHWGYVRERFTALIPPYCFWTALYILIGMPISQWLITPAHTIVGGWLGGYGWAGQYFLIILFQGTLIFPILRCVNSQNNLIFFGVIGLVFNVFVEYFLFEFWFINSIGDRVLFYWLPFIFFGIAMARGLSVKFWLVAAIPALVAAPWELQYLLTVNGAASPYLLASVSIGSAALILSLGPTTSTRIKVTLGPAVLHFRNGLRYIGRNSMPIFLSNPMFLGAFRAIIPNSNNGECSFVYEIFLVLSAISCGLILNYAFIRFGIGVFIGKNNNKYIKI